MIKYKNKYRINSARHPDWDYSNHGNYFVTICTYNRQHFFGDVLNGNMVLSDIGKIVKSQWIKTFEMRPDMNLIMHNYIIMPNHFHAIIGIGKNKYNGDLGRDAMHCVSSFGSQSKNLASIIRGFKIGVTKNARILNMNFKWQTRFHDHIIRNENSFLIISNYIINNPKNWTQDAFHCNS